MNKINKIFIESLLNENNGYIYNPIIMFGLSFDSGTLYHYKKEIVSILESELYNETKVSEADSNKIKILYKASNMINNDQNLEKAYQMARMTTYFNDVLKFINKSMRYMDDFETIRIFNSDRTEYMVHAEKITKKNGYEEIAFDLVENKKTVTCRICYPNEQKCKYGLEIVEDNNDRGSFYIDETCDSIDIFSSREDEYDPIMNKEAIFHISEDGIFVGANLKKHSSLDSCYPSLGDIERSLKYGYGGKNNLSLVVREHYFDEEYIQMQEEMKRMMKDNPPDDESLTKEELQELEEVDSPLYDDGLIVEPTGKLKITSDVIIINQNEMDSEVNDYENDEVIKEILFHSRTKDLINHVIDELDNNFLNARAFIFKHIPLIKDILDTNMEIDNEADELLDQIYNPACDFGEKSYFIGDTNDKRYN